MRGIVLTITAIALSAISYSQGKNDTANTAFWTDMMQNAEVKFSETQKAFEKYWNGRTRSKGDGFNAFKRWEWFMQYELNPDGTYRSPNVIQKEVQDFRMNAQIFAPQSAPSGAPVIQNISGMWESLGPIGKPVPSSGQPSGLGRLNAIGIHPTDDSILFVGSPNGGIWRTYDHGQTWTSNTDTNFNMQISAIEFNPKNPMIVYAGTGDRDAGARTPMGVMKSVDAGIHWSLSNSGMGNAVVGRIIIDPDHPDTLLAATSGGIYRTTDGAATWSRVSSNSPHYKDIVYQPGNFKIQFATAGGAFYRSDDAGQTWNGVAVPINGNRIAIGVTPQDPSYVYLVQTTRTSFAGLLLSTDTGKTFSIQSTSPNIMDWSTTGSGSGGQAWYDLDIAVDPFDKSNVYVGGVNIFKSTDEGKTWRINGHWTGSGGAPAVHADHHVFEWSTDGKTLYNGNDGGIYFTTDGGPNWADLSSGLAISEVYKIGQHAFRENRVICGYQDNGSAIYRGVGDWTTEIGGDGMECAFDYSNNTYVYGALYYGQIRRSSNGGRSFSGITGGISESGAWVTPYILDDGDPKIMYVGMNSDIWRTLDVRANSISWQNITTNVTSTGWTVLESSPVNSNILYAAGPSNKLFRSDNAHDPNPSWTEINLNLFSGNVSDIEAHPWDEDIVYISMGSKVFVSLNKGQSWTDISGNLPNTAKRTLVYDKYSQGGIYVAGTPNIYYTDSNLGRWVEYSNGFPGDVSVTELEMFYDTINPLNSRLRAGTYGRGLWSVDLFEVEKRFPETVIRGDSGYYCTGQVLKLFGDSSKKVDRYNWIITPSSGFTFRNGTTRSSENVEIEFTSEGFYSITLVGSNYYGDDTVMHINGIHIGESAAPVCSTSTASSSTGFGVLRVELNEIDNSSMGYNGSRSWTDYSCDAPAMLLPDSSYTLAVTTQSNERVKAFIDYNGDGDFSDPGEEIGSLPAGTGRRSINFRTPNNPSPNTALSLRVVSDDLAIPGSCASLNAGESEEYSVWFDIPEGTISLSDTVICPNEEIVFSLSTQGKIDSIYWDFGQLAVPSIAYGSGPHTVKFASNGNWKYGVRLNADQWFYDSVNVIAAPAANLVLDSASSSLCEGGSARILVKNQGSVAGNFEWYFNGNLMVNQTDSDFVQSNLNSFLTYEYQVIASNGICVDTSDLLTLVPFDRPTAWISVVRSTQCLIGNEFEFEDVSIFGGNSMTRLWNFGDGNAGSAKNEKHTYSAAGNYTVRLVTTSDKGCGDTTTQTVRVLPNADSTFSFVNTSGNTFEFTPADTNQTTYAWDFGDGNSSQLKKPVHSYVSAGNYNVMYTVTNSDGCESKSTLIAEATEEAISVAEFTAKYGVQVYPNPASGFTQISLNSSASGKVGAALYDASGKLLEELVWKPSELQRIELPQSGIYLIKLTIEGQSVTYRVENQ